MSLIFISLTIILLTLGLCYSSKLIHINTFLFGIFLGILYFIYIPLLVWFINGPMHVLAFPNFYLADIDNYERSLCYLLLYLIEFFLIFFFVKILHKSTAKKLVKRVYFAREIKLYYSAIVLYLVINIIILTICGSFDRGHWYKSREILSTRYHEIGILLSFMIWGLRLLIISYTFEFLERKKISNFMAFVLMIVMCLFELRFVGNRIVILMFGMMGLVFICRTYGILLCLLTICCSLPFAMMIAIYQGIRHLLFKDNISAIMMQWFDYGQYLISSGRLLEVFLTIFEYVDFTVLLKVLNDVGNHIEPIYGLTLIKAVTWYVPRAIWPDKPLPFTILLGKTYMPGTGIALVGLLLGEIHFNFGEFGFVIFPIFLFLTLKFIKILSSYLPFSFYWSMLVGFLIFRLPLSDILVGAIISILIYRLLIYINNYIFFHIKNKLKRKQFFV